MWESLINACRRVIPPLGPYPDFQQVADAMNLLTPVVSNYRVEGEGIPYGRYLLFQDSDDLFNVQVDVFSKGYTGAIHCHETWGCFWVLRGNLHVSDWIPEKDGYVRIRASTLGTGSGQCFCPPSPDWHKTATPLEGDQVVSLHIYGSGYNLDRGIYLDDSKMPRTGLRSPFKDLALVTSHMRTVAGPSA